MNAAIPVTKVGGITFDFTAPDGKVHTVTGPEGATPEQAFSILQQQLAAPPTPVVPAPYPPLPSGFKLDTPPARVALPPLPPGCTLDQPPGAPSPPISTDNSLSLVGTRPGANGAPTRVVMDSSGRVSALHNLAVGTQGVAKGLTDTVTSPFDLAAGAQNLVMGGINKLTGSELRNHRKSGQLARSSAGEKSCT